VPREPGRRWAGLSIWSGGADGSTSRKCAGVPGAKDEGKSAEGTSDGGDTELLRDYLADHPRADEPTAPLFPAMVLTGPKPTGVRAWTGTVSPPAGIAEPSGRGRRSPWRT